MAGAETLSVGARDLLRTGDLQGALAQLKQQVRAAPDDPRLRTFLFQLFCVAGDWERARTQLSVAANLDPQAVPMAQTYDMIIGCELRREQVFRGDGSPTVLGDPGPWLPSVIEATKLLCQGQPQAAARLREAALDAAPESEGSLNGKPCAWIADADPRLGPVLEVFVNGSYLWVPFERLRSLRLDAPADLRDQVWMPASLTWSDGDEAYGFIPTRYPGSATAADTALVLARRTEWYDAAPDWSLPLGQRVLVTDDDEMALMDVRSLQLTSQTAAAASG
jgi:type VI secretion system protein ImpE